MCEDWDRVHICIAGVLRPDVGWRCESNTFSREQLSENDTEAEIWEQTFSVKLVPVPSEFPAGLWAETLAKNEKGLWVNCKEKTLWGVLSGLSAPINSLTEESRLKPGATRLQRDQKLDKTWWRNTVHISSSLNWSNWKNKSFHAWLFSWLLSCSATRTCVPFHLGKFLHPPLGFLSKISVSPLTSAMALFSLLCMLSVLWFKTNSSPRECSFLDCAAGTEQRQDLPSQLLVELGCETLRNLFAYFFLSFLHAFGFFLVCCLGMDSCG